MPAAGRRKAGGVRAAIANVYEELGMPEAALVAVAFTLMGAVVMLSVRNMLTLLLSYAPKVMAARSSVGKYLQPVAEVVKPVVESVFGGATLTIKLEHVLLTALLVVLVGMWRTSYVNSQLLRRLVERDAAAGGGDDEAEDGGAEPAGAGGGGGSGAAEGSDGGGARRRGGGRA